MFQFQRNHRYFAQTQRGLEDIAAVELKELGACRVRTRLHGLSFSGSLSVLSKILLSTRICNRILAPLISFPCPSDRKLYHSARHQIPWDRLMSPADSLLIRSNTVNSRLHHSRYAALKVKDAIVDFFRETAGKRPSVDRDSPDIVFNLFVENDHATISLDLGKGSLHRHGYRLEGGVAPLMETVAAAMVRISGWKGETLLVDPFCGSGTLLAEALMLYSQIPPSHFRREFGIRRLPGFEDEAFQAMRLRLQNGIRTIPDGLIEGSDISEESLLLARRNLSRLPFGSQVVLSSMDFRHRSGMEGVTILTNLPHGRRLTADSLLYHEFGDYLKQNCRGSNAWVLCGSPSLVQSIGLRPSRRIPIFCGGQETRLVHYSIY